MTTPVLSVLGTINAIAKAKLSFKVELQLTVAFIIH